MKTLVWVYGSLKKGFHNNGYLGKAEFKGEAILKGAQLYTMGSYPALGKGMRDIRGELYLVDDATLKNLDGLEQYHPKDYVRSLYIRRKERVTIDGKDCISAMVYFGNPNRLRMTEERRIDADTWEKPKY
jgi:gamma-glutamylcyclotransferase (GGCT)/AIG2-like uncharacterized protein YtfP